MEPRGMRYLKLPALSMPPIPARVWPLSNRRGPFILLVAESERGRQLRQAVLTGLLRFNVTGMQRQRRFVTVH